MTFVLKFFRFWYDFVVGDDWRTAAGVAIGLSLTAAIRAWWLLPILTVMTLVVSLRRATRPR
jgi:hypothetical protein